VPLLLDEKKVLWDTLKDFLQQNELENIILRGDLNLTLATTKKKGGSIV
jgi:hypothetical protein